MSSSSSDSQIEEFLDACQKIDEMTNGSFTRKQLKELRSKNPDIPDLSAIRVVDVSELQKYIRKHQKPKKKKKKITKKSKKIEAEKVEAQAVEFLEIAQSTPRCSDTLRRKTFRTIRAKDIDMSQDISAIHPCGQII